MGFWKASVRGHSDQVERVYSGLGCDVSAAARRPAASVSAEPPHAHELQPTVASVQFPHRRSRAELLIKPLGFRSSSLDLWHGRWSERAPVACVVSTHPLVASGEGS